MRYVIGIGLLCFSVVAFADEPGEREQSLAARNILQHWQKEQPESEERLLHLICWTPADRDLPANYQVRLTRIMKDIRQFYKLEMARHGFPDHTIRLPIIKTQPGSEKEPNDETRLMLHTATGEHPAAHYNVQSGQEVRSDCVAVLRKTGIDPERETIVIFCNLATWDEAKLEFKHKSPYYASGSFRSGTAWQLDSPELDTRNLARTEPMMRDGQYGRISIGKHNSIFISHHHTDQMQKNSQDLALVQQQMESICSARCFYRYCRGEFLACAGSTNSSSKTRFALFSKDALRTLYQAITIAAAHLVGLRVVNCPWVADWWS